MDPLIALIVLGGIVVIIAVVIGNVLSYQSIRAGGRISQTGIRIQSGALGAMFLLAAGFGAFAMIRAGVWPLLILLIPIAALGLLFVVATVRRH